MKNKFFILWIFLTFSTTIHAGTWTEPTLISQVGAWGPWFGVVVDDTNAAFGCSGEGTKAVDISTSNQTKQAQISLLIAAYATQKKVQLFYEACVGSETDAVSVITNVQVVE